MDIPDILRLKAPLFFKHFSELKHPLSQSVQRMLYVSDYAGRQIENLHALLTEDDCQWPLALQDYQQLVNQIPLNTVPNNFAKMLRSFRHRHLLRLFLRELANLAQTAETMTAWSDCADVLILHTQHYCEQQLSQRYGVPRGASGERAALFVLAMGKLGGRELNFSSDIDLIFAYSTAGFTDGEESIDNQQFFSKVVQQMVLLLQNKTVDGFVFRVDLRLRPNGEGGPLVYTLAAMETYYQEQGRDWERYAMVKARPIDGSADAHHWYHRLIMPFVYRRYVDFSVIESLRSMKAMIAREVQLNPLLDDIKRGRGGIREVEFIVQCVQLIRGGRLPQIQTQNALTAMTALRQEGLLAHALTLQQAYLFLRKLENALQLQNDQQTHSLPVDALKKAQVGLMMEYFEWDDLLAKLSQYQRIISHAFHAILGQEDVYQDEKRLLSHQLTSLWQGHVEQTMAINLLHSLGFKQPERCYQMIHAFRHSPRCRRLSQAARMRLDRFMVLLLSELSRVDDTDTVLLQVLSLLENTVGRSAYLALLSENPPALQELLHWFAHSPFITSLIVNQPFLLEVLIDQDQRWRPPSLRQLGQLLQARLAHCVEEDLQDEVMRQFKLTCWLLAARAELYGKCDALRVGRFLADVAEVIIAEVHMRACLRLCSRYPDIMRVKSRFAIIVYGKLGSREMNYDSDLDLVFLHTAPFADEALVTRLTQKILHMLTTRSQTGILYAVDTRLRPSGAAGLLVSHLDAFIDYQRTSAWTWEHQAILRARVLFANRRMQLAFKQLKGDILFIPRDRQSLRADVLNMRKKISQPLNGHAIKYVAGGLLDLEFLVQFLVLAHPSLCFVRLTNTLHQLQQLHAQKSISDTQFVRLKRAYRHYHSSLHRYLLQLAPNICDEHQANVLEISQSLYQ